MIGQKLIAYFVNNPKLGKDSIEQVLLVDAFIEPKIPGDATFAINSEIADITNQDTCAR